MIKKPNNSAPSVLGRGVIRGVFLAALVSVISACGGSSSSSTDTAQIRVIHASEDAPPVNVTLNGTEAISNLDYSESTGFTSVDAGTFDISVFGIVPSGNNPEVIDVNNFELTTNSRTTIVAAGLTAGIMPVIVSDSAAEPSDTQVAVTVLHAAPNAPAVDVFVTSPGFDISMAEPTLTFSFGDDAVDGGALAAGEVQIRVTEAGTTTVVYDSGTIDLAPFAGQQLLIAAIGTTTQAEANTSPVKLLVATDDASLVITDTNTLSGARVVHLSPDAGVAAGGPVEVFASSSALPTSPTELVPSFSYTEVVPAQMPGGDNFVFVPTGDYIFDVAPDTNMIGDSVFMSPTVNLAVGQDFSAIAAGRVAGNPDFTILVSADDARPIVTQAAIKVIHGAPAAGTVDVFVTPAGQFSVPEVEAGMAGEPLLDDFVFGTITDYVLVEPGMFDVRVVAGGTVAINVEGLELAAGSVSTAIARGPIEPMGPPPADFALELLTF